MSKNENSPYGHTCDNCGEDCGNDITCRDAGSIVVYHFCSDECKAAWLERADGDMDNE